MVERRLVFLVCTAAVALMACGAGDEVASAPVATADEPIMGGTTDSADHNVVEIIWLESQTSYGACSGSLLAPNMVLTAHHCVAQLQNSPNGAVDCTVSSFAAPDVPANFYVSTAELMPTTMSGYHTVREVVVPPNSTNTKLCGVDQAILILNDNIAPAEAAPLVPRVDSHVAAGDGYTAIGFGITMDGATDSGTRRKLTGLKVDCVGSPCSSIAGNQIDATHELIGDHGTCEGDSGGPALDQYNRVFGVTSRGATGCEAPIYGDVYTWASWIEQTALTAAKLGGYAAPSWATGAPTDPGYSAPVGAACSANMTCPSYGTCVTDPSGDYCSRLCEASAPCPSGYACTMANGRSVCTRAAQMSTSGTSTGSVSSSGGNAIFFPQKSSGCVMVAADPTKPVPWFAGGALALAAARRRRRSKRAS